MVGCTSTWDHGAVLIELDKTTFVIWDIINGLGGIRRRIVQLEWIGGDIDGEIHTPVPTSIYDISISLEGNLIANDGNAKTKEKKLDRN